MMEKKYTSAELMAMANEAAIEERRELAEATFETLKSKFEGRCYASQSFNNRHRSSHIYAVKYVKFFVHDGLMFVREWKLRMSSYQSPIDPNADRNVSYERSVTNVEVELRGDKVVTKFGPDNPNFKYEITTEKFDHVWSAGGQVKDIVNNVFEEHMPEISSRVTDMHAQTLHKLMSKFEAETGVAVIDLHEYPDVMRAIEYANIPLLQDGRYLPLSLAAEVFNWHYDRLKADIASQRKDGARLELLQRRAQIISDFTLVIDRLVHDRRIAEYGAGAPDVESKRK